MGNSVSDGYDSAHSDRSLRDRIQDTLNDYWPAPRDPIQQSQIKHCREQIIAEIKEWLAIE